jgi:hypothetical protein
MRRLALSLPCAVAVVALAAGDAGAADAGAPRPALPACVQIQTDSRYVPYGYNHVVVIKNGCSKAVTCSVATDVNPDTQKVEVAASSAVEVTTFMGSPSATFVARVSCN